MGLHQRTSTKEVILLYRLSKASEQFTWTWKWLEDGTWLCWFCWPSFLDNSQRLLGKIQTFNLKQQLMDPDVQKTLSPEVLSANAPQATFSMDIHVWLRRIMYMHMINILNK